ncbi:MAG: parallel beta-helix domain-containing protein [Gammaproteobacteria bacterium]|nr:parallel beta-helix domain-containing protein [Gammaproteobacteria bacterium]
MKEIHVLAFAMAFVLSGCGGAEQAASESEPEPDPATRLIEQFVAAEPGTVIEIPAGTFELERSLTLNVDGVTIRGAGMDQTVLSFKDQVAGAEGLLVNASDFTIEDLAIEDTRGDALKINEGTNVIVRRVRTEWTGGPNTENGAYGIYPVQIENVLIEESVAIGASDAGIYVGQSNNIIVRGNRAEYNVAGIEIENSVNADVYDNVAVNNTGGILVFNMPDLPQEGHSTRLFRNTVSDNNTDNFAPEGTAVAGVPAGTGILINSNDRIEIFENTIANNNTANVLITSFHASTLQDRDRVENFDAYPESIYLHDNDFAGGGSRAGRAELEQLRVAMFGETGSLPDIIWDGFVDAEKFVDGKLPTELSICLGTGEVTMLNADAPNGYAEPRMVTDDHRCELEPLGKTELAFVED